MVNSKRVFFIIAAVILIFTVGCKNQNEVQIEKFLNEYYSYIGEVDESNIYEYARNELDYGDKSKLKKYLDKKTVELLITDRQYLNPIYNKLGIEKYELKIDSITKYEDSYRVKYILTFPGRDDLIEEHEIRLAIEDENIIIKSGNLGPTETVYNHLK